ncbi:MAG TPA: hypothetical protein VGQ55_09640 [Pyrinomonadaceae bacterium]|nr:hypothetical protein [Pyrinomonadaceae bacterium]
MLNFLNMPDNAQFADPPIDRRPHADHPPYPPIDRRITVGVFNT